MKIRKLIFSVVTAISVAALLSFAAGSASPVLARGATQVSGVAYWPGPGECTDLASLGASYVVKMTGDLQGCHYTFVESATCSPAGTYVESGHELFIADSSPNDTFRTTYRFEAKYQDCSHAAGEVFGRCQHPIVEGSGEGIFDGVRGRLDLRDNVTEGNFPYQGHLLY
jgi:hypothetical protein